MKQGTLFILAIVCFFACSDGKYKAAESVAELTISFTDQKGTVKMCLKVGSADLVMAKDSARLC